MHKGLPVASWPLLVAFLVVLGSSAAPPAHAEPVFSFWRNLVIGDQTYVRLDYPAEPAPLSQELSDSCCAVRPGQAVTLVRLGLVIGSGRVGNITAAAVPQAGDDRMVFFDVEGFTDSLDVGRGPTRGIDPTGCDYDLFVVGDVEVRELVPEPRKWDPGEDLPAIMERALATKVIGPFSSWSRKMTESPEFASPDTLAVALAEECELIEYKVPMGQDGNLTVQTSQRRSRHFGPFFVRVVARSMSEPVLIRGELDFFLRADGIPYMVLRDQKPSTGAWCYVVYRLSGEGPPKRVMLDGTWST